MKEFEGYRVLLAVVPGVREVGEVVGDSCRKEGEEVVGDSCSCRKEGKDEKFHSSTTTQNYNFLSSTTTQNYNSDPALASNRVYLFTAEVEMKDSYAEKGFDGILLKPANLEALKRLLS